MRAGTGPRWRSPCCSPSVRACGSAATPRSCRSRCAMCSWTRPRRCRRRRPISSRTATIAGSAEAAARRLAAGHGPLAAQPLLTLTSRPRRTGSSGSPPAASSPGVGMTVVERQRSLLVAGVFEDSPAEQGIRPGDSLICQWTESRSPGSRATCPRADQGAGDLRAAHRAQAWRRPPPASAQERIGYPPRTPPCDARAGGGSACWSCPPSAAAPTPS